MIGYIQLYFKVIGEKDTYYVAFDGDFEKPLTWFRLWSLKRIMKRAYEKFDTIHSVDFCSKEEWEENRSDNEIHVNWGD